MPEGFEVCGKQFRVFKRAHKTCDPSAGDARRMRCTWREPGAAEAAHGQALHRVAATVHAICRSITGNGFRRSLAKIQRRIHSNRKGPPVPSGDRCAQTVW